MGATDCRRTTALVTPYEHGWQQVTSCASLVWTSDGEVDDVRVFIVWTSDGEVDDDCTPVAFFLVGDFGHQGLWCRRLFHSVVTGHLNVQWKTLVFLRFSISLDSFDDVVFQHRQSQVEGAIQLFLRAEHYMKYTTGDPHDNHHIFLTCAKHVKSVDGVGEK